jgi:hypothetical protein
VPRTSEITESESESIARLGKKLLQPRPHKRRHPAILSTKPELQRINAKAEVIKPT